MSRRFVAVAAAYGAQGLGYAAVVTALPTFQSTWGLSETTVALTMLGTSIGAAIGSVLADLVAVRLGSKVALMTGLGVEAVAVTLAAFAPAKLVFLAAMMLYGIGLGLVDAAQNMQGVLLEAAAGAPRLGRLYAVFTAASGAGALAMSLSLGLLDTVAVGLGLAVTIDVVVLLIGRLWFDPHRAAQAVGAATTEPRVKLPRRAIWAVGAVVLATYMLDSAVSAWSSIYLAAGLGAAAAVAPLGYAAYQTTVLVSRLATDPLEARSGRVRLAIAALIAGVLGCGVVAVSPHLVGAIVGFAIAGIATGVMVPLAFSAAGELLPSRSDEIIARVNLFNYAGAVLGAVVLGLVASGRGLGGAFLIPGAALVLFSPFIRVLRRGRLGCDSP